MNNEIFKIFDRKLLLEKSLLPLINIKSPNVKQANLYGNDVFIIKEDDIHNSIHTLFTLIYDDEDLEVPEISKLIDRYEIRIILDTYGFPIWTNGKYKKYQQEIDKQLKECIIYECKL